MKSPRRIPSSPSLSIYLAKIENFYFWYLLESNRKTNLSWQASTNSDTNAVKSSVFSWPVWQNSLQKISGVLCSFCYSILTATGGKDGVCFQLHGQASRQPMSAFLSYLDLAMLDPKGQLQVLYWLKSFHYPFFPKNAGEEEAICGHQKPQKTQIMKATFHTGIFLRKGMKLATRKCSELLKYWLALIDGGFLNRYNFLWNIKLFQIILNMYYSMKNAAHSKWTK